MQIIDTLVILHVFFSSPPVFFFLQNYLFMNTIRFQTVCSNVRPDVWVPNCCKGLIEKNSNNCRLPFGHCYVLTNTDLPIIPFLTCKLTVALYGDVSGNIANCFLQKSERVNDSCAFNVHIYGTIAMGKLGYRSCVPYIV